MNSQSAKNAMLMVKNAMRKQWCAICLLAAAVLASAGVLAGMALLTNQVTVLDGENQRTILTMKDDIGEILEDNHYFLGKDDKIQFTGLENHAGTATILRAFDVPVTADGRTRPVAIAEGTVSDVLKKGGITLGQNDLVSLDLSTEVEPGTNIVVQRVTYEEKTVESAIPFETQTISSINYQKGYSVVTKEGREGILSTKLRTQYVDGKEMKTEHLEQIVTQEPEEQIVTVGTARSKPVSTLSGNVQLDENGLPVSYSRIISGKSAAYSARPGAKTASGRPAIVGHVAVDPKIIPYGTKLYITSTDSKDVYGYCIAADTGTALLDGRILVDLFFDSYASSCRWGVHQVNIYVLD